MRLLGECQSRSRISAKKLSAFLVVFVFVTGSGSQPTQDSSPVEDILIINNLSSTSLKAAWSKVDCSVTGIVTKYELYYETRVCGRLYSHTSGPLAASTTDTTLVDLHPDQEYLLVLTAFFNNSDECAIWSRQNTLGDVPSGAPRNPRIFNANLTTATVAWAHVSCNETNGVITDYEVTYSTWLDGERKTDTVKRDNKATSTILKDLHPKQQYTISVRAYNQNGAGPHSNDIINVCRPEEVFLEETNSNHKLPLALEGEVIVLVTCVSKQSRTVVSCQWGDESADGPRFKVFRNESLCPTDWTVPTNPSSLANINLTAITEDTALLATSEILSYTREVQSPTYEELGLIADAFEQIATAVRDESADVSERALMKLVELWSEVVSNLMEVTLISITEDDQRAYQSAASSLAFNMEDILRSLTKALAETTQISGFAPEGVFAVNQANVAYQVVLNESVSGIYVCDENNLFKAYSTAYNEQRNSCSFPASIQIAGSHSGVPKSFIAYRNSKLFQGSSRAEVVGVKVLGAQLKGGSVHNAASMVDIEFEVNKNLEKEMLRCAYWNFSIDDWSKDGCEVAAFFSGNVVCACNHLTHFAVLLDRRPVQPNGIHQEILTVITLVGLSVSILALGMVLVTFMLFRSMRKTDSQKVLFCLALSLLCLNLLFLAGIDRTEVKELCIAVAAAMHYFLLASFAWMLVEGVLQYLRLVKVLHIYIPKFILKASLPAWSIPALVVVPVCIYDPSLYQVSPEADYCWVSHPVLLYGVLLPIGCVIVTNIVVFVMIVVSIKCGSGRKLRSNKSQHNQALLHLRASLSVFVLLGISWTFGILVVEDDGATLVFQYIFCILNSLQGLVIFVFHNVRERTVRNQWTRLCCPSKTRRDSTTTSWNKMSKASVSVES